MADHGLGGAVPPAGAGEIVLATPAPVTHRTAEENLGLGYLAAVLRRAGYRVWVLDAWLEGWDSVELARRILAVPKALFVGFACYRSNMAAAMATGHQVRAARPGLPVIAGGYGPTFHAEDFVGAGFDVAVRGEAEDTVLELAAHYACGDPSLADIRGITFPGADGVVETPVRRPAADLDALPLPARDTLDLALKRRSLVHIQSSRGCQASCTFCSIVAFERLAGGPTWRQRSIPGVVDELEALASRGVRHLKVIDDSFVEPPRDAAWCAAFADEIERRGLSVHLRGSIRADRVTPEVLAHLKRAGFWSFSCGVENFSPTALRRMAKRADLVANLAALEAFRSAGMVVQAGHILFDHATTWEELHTNCVQMRRHLWTISKGVFTEMYAAAGTAFTRSLGRVGLLAEGPAAAGTGGLGNATYAVRDPVARAVYVGLKRWQRSHTRTYDMTIDPLSAPKAIEPQQRSRFHELSIRLRRHDLTVFQDLLDLTSGGGGERESLDYIEDRLRTSAPFYQRIEQETQAAYLEAGLVYDADENPFIC